MKNMTNSDGKYHKQRTLSIFPSRNKDIVFRIID